MSPSTVLAASCVALCNAIIQVMLDTGRFARKVRESRHDMSSINAKLLAIKLFLEIFHDDLSAVQIETSLPLLDVILDILSSCDGTIETLHKRIVRLPVNCGTQEVLWSSIRGHEIVDLLQQLGALQLGLDLSLDLTSIFLPSSSRNNGQITLEKPEVFGSDSHKLLELSTRLDVHLQLIEHKNQYSGKLLRRWLSAMKRCAESIYEEAHKVDKKAIGYDLPGRRDEYEQSNDGSSAIHTFLMDSGLSENHRRPIDRPQLVTIMKPKKKGRSDLPQKSIDVSTFYSESSTSGSGSTRMSKHLRVRLRDPKPVPKAKTKRKSFYALPITAESHELIPNESMRYANEEKTTIARSKRKKLSQDQKVALDWGLRNIKRSTTPAYVERILREGADPNVEDPDFGFLYTKAANQLPTSILRLLVNYGANITNMEMEPNVPILNAAVVGKNLENVQYLLDLGICLEVTNFRGETALHVAAKTAGAYPIAKTLVDAGADVNASSNDGSTPLQSALFAPDIESKERSMIVELLLAHGAVGEISSGNCTRRGKGLSVLGII
ncbi:hypothetical protein CC78DRAFT_604402 [Lojkania enalia]|uniref:Ankyrin n=1 Tax=Lojkania enalia TaxID=147567 RepID=A0A9P4N2D8_9PLEO|nr:hypothetical protein CC78DRAFT_604402 [Didymosphaeria enalia]